jgi:hypothetical protein
MIASIKGNNVVKWLVQKGGASIKDHDGKGWTPLLLAAQAGKTSTVAYLLREGASITEATNTGLTPLFAACNEKPHLNTVAWLLEHGGADMSQLQCSGSSRHKCNGKSIWHQLGGGLSHVLSWDDEDDDVRVTMDRKPKRTTERWMAEWRAGAAEVDTLLKVLVLRQDPPPEMEAHLSRKGLEIMHTGARIRAQLPAYRARRLALLGVHCPLLPPLLALVSGYAEPTTTSDFWHNV